MIKPKHQIHSEKQLVVLLKEGDKASFEYIYKHYSPALYNVTCKILGDQVKAQDTLQDAFIKIWANMQRYETSKGSLFTWMLNITRNAAIDILRSENSNGQTCSDWGPAQDYESLLTLVVNPGLHTVDLRFFVDRLIPERRLMIQMVYFEGYTHLETAEHLSIPLGTVKSRIREGLKDLRRVYAA